jgi:hypothetical protein
VLPQHAETLRWQIERSPFSEDITIAGNGGEESVAFETAFEAGEAGYGLAPLDGGETGVVVRGIFDVSIERDEGNKATRRKPRVTVYAVPCGTKAGTRVTVRDKEYAVTSYEADANLGIVVWLR